MAVDVGLDLAPEQRPCAATAEADARDGDVHLAEKRERVAQTEGDAFEDSANDVSASVRSGEADQRSANAGIEMRRALAHQIGRPQEAVGTGRNLSGFGSELIVGFAGTTGACSEGVAKPAQGEPGGLRYAHDMPASWNGVAEGVDAAEGIERRAVGGGKNDAGGADGGADGSGGDDAHAGGSGGLIARTGYNRSTNAQTCFRGSLCR